MSSREEDALTQRVRAAAGLSGPTIGQEEEDPDEIARRVALASQQMQDGPNFFELLRQIVEGAQNVAPSAIIDRLVGGTLEGRPGAAIEEEAGRALATTSGLAEASAGSLIAGGRLANAAIGVLPGGEDTRTVFNILNNSRNMLTAAETKLEKQAREYGASDKAIQESKMIGGFVGYGVPLSMSVKIAGRLGLGGVGFVRDAGVGAIMGGVFREGSGEERLKHAAQDAALFGMLSMLTMGIAIPIMMWRNKRIRFKSEFAGEEANLDRLRIGTSEEGAPRVIFMEEDPVTGVFKMLNEEQYIVQSPAAQKLLAMSGDERALVTAIRQISEVRSGTGVLHDFNNAEALIPMFKEAMPNLKFSIVRNGATGTKDIIFGEKGLNNAARAQYAKQGVYRGQWGMWNGMPIAIERVVKDVTLVRDLTTGKLHRPKTENVKPLPWGTPAGERTAFPTAMYDDLERWLENKHREINKQRVELTEEQFVREVREGKITAEDLARARDVKEPALVYPAEIGMMQEEVMKSAEEALQDIAKEGFASTHVLAPRPETAFEDMVRLYMKERGLTGRDRVEFTRAAAHEMRQRLWKSVNKKDRELAESIREDMQKALENSNLEERAAMSGLRMTEKDGLVTLRDINSGVEYSFPTRAKAQEAVNATVRVFEEEGAGAGLPPDFFNMPAPVIHGPLQDSFALLPNADINKAFQNALPVQIYHPLRDWFDIVQTRSGLKLYSGGFQLMEDGMRFAENEYRPLRSLIGKRLGRNTSARINAADGLKAVALKRGTTTTVDEAVAELNLSAREIRIIKDVIAFGERANEVAGLPATSSNYVLDYYGIMQPHRMSLEAGKAKMDFKAMFPGGTPPMVQHVHDLTRLGNEMSLLEIDPAQVLNKLFRNILFKKHVEPAWNNMRDLVADASDPLRLTATYNKETRAKIVDSLGGEDGLRTLNKAVKDYTSLVRGYPQSELRTARQMSKRIFGGLGIKGKNNELIIDELVSSYASAIYGSLIGWNPRLIVRNVTQNINIGYPRLGGEYMMSGLRKALTPEGFNHALRAGAPRPREGGVPGGDIFFDTSLAGMPLESNTMVGHMSRNIVKGALATGKGLQRMTRTGMTGFSSADDANRVWMFWWQRDHTQAYLRRWQQGRISERRFREDGMPFFSENVRDEFMLRLTSSTGSERALDYIGKMGSDEVNFIYGSNAAPLMLQSTAGRLGGMFTTWPLWGKEAFWTRMKRGTPKQKAAFWARTASVMGTIYLIGKEYNLDLTNWMAPLSPLTVSAGPVVDLVITANDFFNASLSGKPAQAARLGVEALGYAVPGHNFYRGVKFSLEESESPEDMFFNLTLGRHTANRNNYFLDVQLNPNTFIPGIDQEEPELLVPLPQTGLQSAPDSSQLRSNVNRRGGGQ